MRREPHVAGLARAGVGNTRSRRDGWDAQAASTMGITSPMKRSSVSSS